MIQTVLVNVTLAWIFSIVLIFVYSKNDFEASQINRVSKAMDNLTIFAKFVNPRSVKNPSVIKVMNNIIKRKQNRERSVQDNNKKLLTRAMIASAVLVFLTILATIRKINIRGNQFDTRDAILGVIVAVFLLITEIMLYFILFRSYDYGTEEYIYKSLSDICKDIAC